ncbi:MAG: RNA polymerase sigma factor [Bacteroidales bacterium]|nr:RNA polymerase sigma factor [Bacteroidales bacterium]MCF8402488.1 RNA polymerase sigma factor [Bacteroidales bacterium]
MYAEEELVNRCLNQESKAQDEFYRRFAPKMYGVCLRFAKNQMEADDVLQEGFIKVFTSLKTFRNEGSLEGWIRRTIVNTAINFYKKNVKYQKDIEIDKAEVMQSENPGAVDNLCTEELLKLITELPTGYKMVFNLNVIEGYTHKEISHLLDISENTSKSQLSRARQTLQRKIAELSGKKHE